MFRFLKWSWCFVLCLSLNTLSTAQDLNFSYFEMVPLTFNPANAGGYQGTLRFSGIFRVQETNVGDGYQSMDIGAEYNLPFRPRGRDWISADLSVFRDRAGFALNRSGMRIGAAYHLALDKKAKRDLAIGVQFIPNSLSSDRLDIMDARAGLLLGNDKDITRFNMGSAGGGNEADNNNSTSYSDFGVGLVYSMRSKAGETKFGLSAYHPLMPSRNFSNGQIGELPLRLTGFATMDRMLNKKMSIMPAVLFQTQGGATDIQLHGLLGYSMPKVKDLRLKAGLGYRVADAAMVLLGADFKDWKFGLAYDFIASSLSEATTFGGLEFSAIKGFNIDKKPDIKPVIMCPRI